MIADHSYKAENTSNGNNSGRFLSLKPYGKARITDDCELDIPIPLTENIGMIAPMDRLPGCNPITYSIGVRCSQGAQPSTMNKEGTFHIQSKTTGRYLTFNPTAERVLANASTKDLNYRKVWGFGWVPRNLGQTVRNPQIGK
jgi:hypothetical protein